ncbi:DUF3347 domain-containing protein [Gracilimonas sediminicola]|uniref:DUF3347 domain-containing protein n=1 Tax=Gracilimonas sediminicola TaxID=2952158 RepID=A0A9X2RBV8_9BACT|nr:DUF3347 domain-containing protein [Gracilimonas sediminicola]MCP9290560.1 DUF3347 domain-containing protein [Gracilimonas sediminicola]
MKTLLTLILTTVISIPAFAQDHSNHSHNEHLNTLVSEYVKIKEALVKDDFEQAKKYLAAFTLEAKTNDDMNSHHSHADKHISHHNKMADALNQAESAQSISQLRDAFDEISIELLSAIENQDYKQQTIYVQFCSMANKGEGSKWLSTKKTIENPYYGQSMLGCGDIIKTIQ